jgi:ribosomal protein L37AE/L43A
MTTKMPRCPQCGEEESLRRSRSRWYDYPLRVVGVRAWRCLLCDRRFYGRKRTPEVPEGDEAPG